MQVRMSTKLTSSAGYKDNTWSAVDPKTFVREREREREWRERERMHEREREWRERERVERE